MPEPTSPYYKLHIATERIGRNGERMSRLGPPVKIRDTKSMISRVTGNKGPASRVTDAKKSRSSAGARKNPGNPRIKAIKQMKAKAVQKSGGATKQSAAANQASNGRTANSNTATESRKSVVSASKPGENGPVLKGGVLSTANAANSRNKPGPKAKSVIPPKKASDGPSGKSVVRPIKTGVHPGFHRSQQKTR
jgi:hypothetical protein